MRASVGRTVFRRVPPECAPVLSGIILRIEFGPVARGLSLLTRIVILIEPRTASSAFAMIPGCAWPGYDIGDKADAADECEKCAKAGWFHDLDVLWAVFKTEKASKFKSFLERHRR